MISGKLIIMLFIFKPSEDFLFYNRLFFLYLLALLFEVIYHLSDDHLFFFYA